MSRCWPSLVLALVAAPLAAQGKPIELGVDAAFIFKVNDPTAFLIQLPVGSFRAGFFVSDQFSIEPAVSLNYLKLMDADAVYTLGGELGALIHFSKDASKTQAFVRPLVGIRQMEAPYQHAFETSAFGASEEIFLSLGLSFFTR